MAKHKSGELPCNVTALIFPICHSYTNMHLFVSKNFQELLNLEFQNLVQSLGMSSCIVYLKINNFWLIIPFIYPFFSLSEKFFHHISSVCIRVRDFKFYMTNSVTENKITGMILWFYFFLLFPSVTPIQICTFLSRIRSIRGYIVFAFLFMNIFLLD